MSVDLSYRLLSLKLDQTEVWQVLSKTEIGAKVDFINLGFFPFFVFHCRIIGCLFWASPQAREGERGREGVREKELGDSFCEYERDRKARRESEYKVRKIEKET